MRHLTYMATATDIREISRRLEAKVAAHGCGCASCSLCDDFDCLVPVQATDTRPVAEQPASAQPVRRMGLIEVVDVPAILERQDAVFWDALPDY
jgi:hypothetical protein